MAKSKDRPILEAALESGQELAKALATSEVVSELPAIGIAIKICKAADSIRDRILLAKIKAFTDSTDSESDDRKRAWREKMASEPEESQVVGEALLIALDRFDEIEKAKLAATLFAQYLDRQIRNQDLRRFLSVVDRGFLADLRAFLAGEFIGAPHGFQDPTVDSLVSLGLVEWRGSGGDASRIFDEIARRSRTLPELRLAATALGMEFSEAYTRGLRSLQGAGAA